MFSLFLRSLFISAGLFYLDSYTFHEQVYNCEANSCILILLCYNYNYLHYSFGILQENSSVHIYIHVYLFHILYIYIG